MRPYAASDMTDAIEFIPLDEEALAVEDPHRPEDATLDRELREALDRVLVRLSVRCEFVLRLRFGLPSPICLADPRPHSLREIGDRLGVTAERARGIEEQAWRDLHRLLCNPKTPGARALRDLGDDWRVRHDPGTGTGG